jgi:hypothetical protein
MIEATPGPCIPVQAPATAPGSYQLQTVPAADALLHPGKAGCALGLQESSKAKHQQAVPEPAQSDPAAAQPQANEDGAPVEAQPRAELRTEKRPDPEAFGLPPIEPPRSWTKEAKQRFRSLPRETQEYLSVRERERDREVRRSQNEAAEARKAVEAQRKAAAQAKQQYEQTLPRLLEVIEAATAGEYSDIRTYEDAEKLAKEDPLRYARYGARQQKLAHIAQEAKAAEARQRAEQAQQWNQYAAKQDELFIEQVPEFADVDSRLALQQAVMDYLSEIGFSREEMAALYHGSAVRDARIQMAILDGARYRQVCNLAKTALQISVPPVQRNAVNQLESIRKESNSISRTNGSNTSNISNVPPQPVLPP